MISGNENGAPAEVSQLTPELWQQMQRAAQAAGLNVAPPDDEKTPSAPTLSLELGWRRLGMELGGILRLKNIFLRAGDMGRVHETTGEWQRFDAKNFAGWVEEFVAFQSRGQKAKLSAEQAAMLMAQFTFRDQIRELQGIHLVTLPVYGEGGRLRWLGRGYDAGTRIFTVPQLDYELDWTVEKAVGFLQGTFGSFPWMRGEGEDGSIQQNRSFAVHLSAMLGVYCRAMFEAGTLRPMVLWVANEQGSGKTVLAQSVLAPVYGLFAGTALPKNDDELRKTLNTAARAYSQFLFFDDIPFLKSNHLNRFITEPRHSDRGMGGDDLFDVPAVTQILATGNDVKGSRDIALRAMVVELFFAGDLGKRELPAEIDAVWLATPAVRRQFLSAMCALVSNWDRRAEMGEGASKALDGIKGMPRFGTFTRLVAGMVRAAYFADPLSAPLMPLDEDVDQMRDLLVAVGERSESSMTWTREQIVELARELELCEDLVGAKEEKALDAASSRRFGYKMREFRGRELMDSKGRKFTFGHQKKRTGATYPVTFVQA